MPDLYTATVTARGGRQGRAASDDGLLDLLLAFPRALGGSGDATNPEQLFAAGFAACFTSSLEHAARTLGHQPGAVSVTALATLGLDDAGRYGLTVTLRPELPGLAPEQRAAVLREAERICAYTNATRGNVGLSIV